MSGIGEAASIAGLITITGQCVQQISKLYSFVRDFQNVVPQTTSLLHELELLQQCLSQVQTVASRALAVSRDLFRSVNALFRVVDQCQDTITQIEDQLRAVYPGKKKMLWNRFKVTVARDFFARFQAQISAQKQDLILHLDALSCELDLRTYDGVELLTASSRKTQRKLYDLARDLDHRHDLSECHLQTLDARLQMMQNMLQQSISTNQRRSLKSRIRVAKSRYSNHVYQRPKALNASETQTWSLPLVIQPLQVVSPALLMYEKDGVLQRELVPLKCKELNGLDNALKIQMIKYLQGLRLLIWLLGRNNFLAINATKLENPSRSLLAMQAGMASSWQFSTALWNLTISLKIPHSSLDRLSWLKNRPWFQHVLDKAANQSKDGEEFMALVVKNWQHFPPPDGGQGIYTLSVPGRLLKDPLVKVVRSSYSQGLKECSCQNPRGMFQARAYQFACLYTSPPYKYSSTCSALVGIQDGNGLGRENASQQNASSPATCKDNPKSQPTLPLSSKCRIQPEKSKYDLDGGKSGPPNALEKYKQQASQIEPKSVKVSPQDGQNPNAIQQPPLNHPKDPSSTNQDKYTHTPSRKERFAKK
ncbi:MAG: hypothetical protein Q9214_001745 [Letrouitia sp. 1 TL-2023]